MLTQIRLHEHEEAVATACRARHARFKVEDMTGSIEAVMWSEDYARYQEFIVDDQVCFVTGTSSRRTARRPILQVTKIVTLEQGAKERTSGMVLVMYESTKVATRSTASSTCCDELPGHVRSTCMCATAAASGSSCGPTVRFASIRRSW